MALLSHLSRVFATTAATPVSAVNAEPMPQTERKVALRCLGCNSWNRSRLVYMSNGGDYCFSCAKRIARTYGYSAAGKRWTDVTSLD